GFLPSRALVMARTRTPDALAAAVETETPAATASAAFPSIAPAASLAAPTAAPQDRAARLAQVAVDLQGCTRCKLCEKRKTIVVGEGNPEAELVFVGEGPGENEDIAGRPF